MENRKRNRERERIRATSKTHSKGKKSRQRTKNEREGEGVRQWVALAVSSPRCQGGPPTANLPALSLFIRLSVNVVYDLGINDTTLNE